MPLSLLQDGCYLPFLYSSEFLRTFSRRAVWRPRAQWPQSLSRSTLKILSPGGSYLQMKIVSCTMRRVCVKGRQIEAKACLVLLSSTRNLYLTQAEIYSLTAFTQLQSCDYLYSSCSSSLTKELDTKVMQPKRWKRIMCISVIVAGNFK